jgi:hypothetical protein
MSARCPLDITWADAATRSSGALESPDTNAIFFRHDRFNADRLKVGVCSSARPASMEDNVARAHGCSQARSTRAPASACLPRCSLCPYEPAAITRPHPEAAPHRRRIRTLPPKGGLRRGRSAVAIREAGVQRSFVCPRRFHHFSPRQDTPLRLQPARWPAWWSPPPAQGRGSVISRTPGGKPRP